MSSQALNVYGYARVSTEKQADKGVSLKDQEAMIRAYCVSRGMGLVDILADPGESSKTLDRPRLQFILGQLRDGQADGIVVSKLNRLTRHIGDMCHLVETYFSGKGISHLFSASDSVETRTANGRMIIFILTVVDQRDREGIVENTVGTLKGKRSRSESVGNVPFGMMIDPDDPRRSAEGKPVALIPCPEDLEVLALIRSLRVEKCSHREIAEELNSRGIPSKRGVTRRSTGLWSKTSVREILLRDDAPPCDDRETTA